MRPFQRHVVALAAKSLKLSRGTKNDRDGVKNVSRFVFSATSVSA